MNEALTTNIGETTSGLAEFQGGKEKLEIVMPKLQAMNGSEVRQFNLSVPATTSASIRIWQSYLADKAQFQSTFTPKGFDAEGNCEVTPSDLNEAKQLSTLMLEALTAAPEGTVPELKDLRARAGEYLRRGADQIRTAAEYIFRDDPSALSRYPSLHQIKYPSRSRSRTAVSEEPAPQIDDTDVEA